MFLNCRHSLLSLARRSTCRLKFGVPAIRSGFSASRSSLSAPLTTSMALVTIDTVVNVAADIRVLEIGSIIAAVASGALEDGIVV